MVRNLILNSKAQKMDEKTANSALRSRRRAKFAILNRDVTD
jgi:hypothetical protein